MDGKLHKTLTDCIRDIATGARDVEGCLQQHPDRAAELRPHLELWSRLNTAPKAEPNFSSQQRGQHRLLGALADMEKEREGRTTRFLTPALVKAAAVVAGVALLAGGAAGASAAFGGPDFADEVLSTVGITSSHDGTPPAAEDGHATADDGAANSGGEPAAAEDGQRTADRGADNSDGVPPAAEDGRNTAEGAADSTSQGDGPPESVPASDSVPEDANLPVPLPAGPKP
jgi:hypothetical protein